MRRADERGQATVELALLMPLIVVLLVVVVEMGALARQQVLVTHAAREGARAAAVDADPGAVSRAVRDAGPLDARDLDVDIGARGDPGSRVTVRVRYSTKLRIPVLRNLVGPVTLDQRATMRVER